jgi:hypothetical protein
MACGYNEHHVPFICHFDLIDRKLVEVHGSLWPFICPAFSFGIPHQKFSSWNRHHGDRVKLFGSERRCHDWGYGDGTG